MFQDCKAAVEEYGVKRQVLASHSVTNCCVRPLEKFSS